MPSPAGESLRVSVLSAEPGHVLGVVDNVLVALTREPPSVDSVQGFTERAEQLIAKHPEGIAVLIIPRAPKPALRPGVPRAVLRAWRALQPRLTSCAVLIRSGGVAGALQRGLITPLINSSPNALPVKLCASPYDAAEWIARHGSAREGESLALGRAVAAFVQEHEAQQS